MERTQVSSFAAGVVLANSLPHLATAITGRRHLTPLAGRNSGPTINAVWAAVNIGAGVALLIPSRRRGGRRWGPDLNAFGMGAAAFATWMAVSEAVFPVNAGKGEELIRRSSSAGLAAP